MGHKDDGDGLLAVFASAVDGVDAVVAGQRALHAEDLAETASLRVRMALHTGEAEMRDGDYFGTALNRAARLMAVGAGGQSLALAGDRRRGPGSAAGADQPARSGRTPPEGPGPT